MPEHPEIRAFVNYMNISVEDTVFHKIQQYVVDEQKQYLQYTGPFKLFAEQRGKQIRLTLTHVTTECDSPLCVKSSQQSQLTTQSSNSPQDMTYITLGLGLCGYFTISLSKQQGCLFSMQSSSYYLSLMSDSPESVYYSNSSFDQLRSPDPVFEFDLFKQNLLSQQSTQTPICTFLLNQRFFNGVGNYIRCELLHRLDLNPFEPVSKIDLGNLAEELLSYLEEAFECVNEPDQFVLFLQCYGKANNCVKIEGRNLWTWRAIKGERASNTGQKEVKSRMDHVKRFMAAMGGI
ncbi:Formamidopyrimidine-DNA_glycosylase [Hexamita inflata]|uniref:Formamidopyrimidine-DNA glycosylase n=1 Tax=Hexamita inflata TaxID=28002 RepID=A0AA86RLY2_9EUKA|nr:Formamidopyrimidine-DNA glycosylase [Hexamita inflata]